MLAGNPYVVVPVLDFSKAFDTVRHCTLLQKLAQLSLPDNVYNWLVDYFCGHSHRTMFESQQSSFKPISASIVQGSAIGPAAYVATAGDLQVKTSGNQLVKYADDTYLVIPASNIHTRTDELNNIDSWARQNNLTLNRLKTKELVIVDRRRKRPVTRPPVQPGIARVTSLKILGVTVTDRLVATDHVNDVISGSAQTLYAMRVLRHHGLAERAIQSIFQSVVIAKLLYASSAWWGFTSATDRMRIDAFIRHCSRSGYCAPNSPSFDELCKKADRKLLGAILNNQDHVLHHIASTNSSLSELRTKIPTP